MVREERSPQNDRLSPEGGPPPGALERWISMIQKEMPPEATLWAGLQLRPKRGFIATFKIRLDGECLSSEAKAESAAEAFERAGEGLWRHLEEWSASRRAEASQQRPRRAEEDLRRAAGS
jgi:hypothetical protein